MAENSGGSCSYYEVQIAEPMKGRPYRAECTDIMEALQMTPHEVSAFKALWRTAAGRLGKEKQGHTALRDYEKVAFAGNALVKKEKRKLKCQKTNPAS